MFDVVPVPEAAYWDRYHRSEAYQARPAGDRFRWTTGVEAGADILGSPKTALDLGPAEGENAAYLARHGAQVVAVDLSPVQITRARAFWGDVPGLEFVHAEACAFLDADLRQWEAIYSSWGAVWFTDPAELLPRIRARLAPGGVFAFSHRAANGGPYGERTVSGKWLETDITARCWHHTPKQWTALLEDHGFTNVRAEILPEPEPGGPSTLLVRAST